MKSLEKYADKLQCLVLIYLLSSNCPSKIYVLLTVVDYFYKKICHGESEHVPENCQAIIAPAVEILGGSGRERWRQC